MTTKTEQLVKALKNGQELTARQISSRFGIANVTATIHYIRTKLGYAVYLNERKNSLGESYMKYRIGTPSKKVVAAGYKALSLGIF